MKYEIRVIKDAKEVFNIITNLENPDSFRVNKHTANFAFSHIRSRIIAQLEEKLLCNFVVKNEVFEKVFKGVSSIPTVAEAYINAYAVDPAVQCRCSNVFLMAENAPLETLERCLETLEEHAYKGQDVTFIVLVPDQFLVWANY